MQKTIENIQTNATTGLEEKGFYLYRHHVLTPWQARKIVDASTEPAMRQWAPDDHDRRFSDKEGAIQRHQQDKRFLYAIGRQATLAGLAWFTEKPCPNPEISAEYTYAIRLYEPMRGQGLGQAVMGATHDAFYSTSGYAGAT
jgi:hypothetical protein